MYKSIYIIVCLHRHIIQPSCSVCLCTRPVNLFLWRRYKPDHWQPSFLKHVVPYEFCWIATKSESFEVFLLTGCPRFTWYLSVTSALLIFDGFIWLFCSEWKETTTEAQKHTTRFQKTAEAILLEWVRKIYWNSGIRTAGVFSGLVMNHSHCRCLFPGMILLKRYFLPEIGEWWRREEEQDSSEVLTEDISGL